MYTSVKNLKDHLSALLHRVCQGEEVIVTLHNKPVVRLTPIFEGKETTRNGREVFLEEIKDFHKKFSKVDIGKPSSEILLEMRKKERN